jgi:hypothetical protein
MQYLLCRAVIGLGVATLIGGRMGAQEQRPGQISEITGGITDPQEALGLLRTLAQEAVELNEGPGRRRFAIENGAMRYDFSPGETEGLTNRPDKLTVPLEILIRVSAVRRDLSSNLREEDFWLAPIQAIEDIASGMVRKAYQDRGSDGRSALEADKRKVEMAFLDLGRALQGYADRKEIKTVAARGSVGYRVIIRLEPPQGRLRMMPYLDFRRCQLFHIPLDEQWNDFAEGTYTLAGRYHYRLEWPQSLNGPVEANHEFTASGTLTLRPLPK